MNRYSIPKIFFKKYFNQLSPKTFCFLIKLYQHYLDSSIVYYQDLKGQIFDSHQEMEEACSELIRNNIITYEKIYNKKKNHIKYTLEYLDEKKVFVILYNIKVRRKGHNITEKYIENVLSKFDEDNFRYLLLYNLK